MFQLVKRGRLGLADVISILPSKFSVKGLNIEEIEMDYVENRRDEFERDWDRNLRYLLPTSEDASFEEAWEMLLELFRQIVDSS